MFNNTESKVFTMILFLKTKVLGISFKLFLCIILPVAYLTAPHASEQPSPVDISIVESVTVTDLSQASPPIINATESISVVVSADVGPQTFTITATAGPNGSIAPSGDVVLESIESQTFTITPDFSYKVSDVIVDGVSQGPLTSYTFTSVASDHTINATFEISAFINIIESITVNDSPALLSAAMINVVEPISVSDKPNH